MRHETHETPQSQRPSARRKTPVNAVLRPMAAMTVASTSDSEPVVLTALATRSDHEERIATLFTLRLTTARRMELFSAKHTPTSAVPIKALVTPKFTYVDRSPENTTAA